MTVKVYKREAILIRSNKLSKELRDDLTERYTHRFYNDKACGGCEFLPDRHSDVCDNCAAYLGGSQLAKNVKINKKPYFSLPIGDLVTVEKVLKRERIPFKVVSKHPDKPFKRPIKFTGQLRDYQPDAVNAILDKKKGVLQAPPRSGKTVMGTAAICKIGKKTLILASQRDWLVGFYETFCGSKTQKPLTNAKGSGVTPAETREYLKKHKRAGIGFCRTYDQFMRHDVCLATVQTFYSEAGVQLLRKLRDKFSVIVVDEIHTGAAPKYASVLARLNTEYKLGLTGTPDRKDLRYILVEKLIGPALYEVKVDRLRPRVRLVRTEYVDARKQAQWHSLVNRMETDPKRLKLIAQHALKDVKDGHMVLIPLARVKAIKVLTETINRMAGKKIAAAFYGGVKSSERDQYITDARNYKLKVLVGQAKLLSTGINIPRASCLYETTFSSNIPNCTQRVSRILTPYEDKPPPILRIFLDDSQVRRACLRVEWYQCMLPKFRVVTSEKDLQIMRDYLSSREREEKWEL